MVDRAIERYGSGGGYLGYLESNWDTLIVQKMVNAGNVSLVTHLNFYYNVFAYDGLLSYAFTWNTFVLYYLSIFYIFFNPVLFYSF